MERLGASLPLGSASTCSPALSVTVVWPLTLTVPSKTLIWLLLSGRTRTSNSVPLTSALTEWPPTWNDEPPARCWTSLRVRPIFCWMVADFRLPALFSCADWIVIVVSGETRISEPSGNCTVAWPVWPARTELPASSDWPEMAGW